MKTSELKFFPIVFLLGAMLIPIACLDVRDEDVADHPDGEEGCKSCHHAAGSEELARCDVCHAYPTATLAHSVHVDGGPFEKPMFCEDCHPVPAEWFAAGHLDGVVQVVFSEESIASAGGLAPAWNGQRCENVYCHGASLSGGTNTAPAWRENEEIACGACHGIPPTENHVTSTECDFCHAAAYDEGGNLDTERHLNGFVDMQPEEE